MPKYTEMLPESFPAYEVWLALTGQRTGDSPLLPKSVYETECTARINAAEGLSDNVAALLHLLNDDLNSAHVLCQAHEDDPTANYIHQIVHRREGDWGNTRYWVMKTGPHPFYAELAPVAKQLGTTEWDPNEMIKAASRGEHFAAGISDYETQGLLAWCVQNGK